MMIFLIRKLHIFTSILDRDEHVHTSIMKGILAFSERESVCVREPACAINWGSS